MTFVVYGQCLWFVFMGLCLWLCVWICVYGCVWICMDVLLAVCIDLYGYRVLILREARFNKYRGLPLPGARFHHYWDLLLHEAHSNDILGLTHSRGPFQ
jgi:hypothetical protein